MINPHSEASMVWTPSACTVLVVAGVYFPTAKITLIISKLVLGAEQP